MCFEIGVALNLPWAENGKANISPKRTPTITKAQRKCKCRNNNPTPYILEFQIIQYETPNRKPLTYTPWPTPDKTKAPPNNAPRDPKKQPQ